MLIRQFQQPAGIVDGKQSPCFQMLLGHPLDAQAGGLRSILSPRMTVRTWALDDAALAKLLVTPVLERQAPSLDCLPTR